MKYSKESIRVDPVVNAFAETVDPVVNSSEVSSVRKKHARIPWEVGTDERLSDRDVRVYFALSSFTRTGPHASAGIRWISDCIHAPARYVIKSLKKLAELKHVKFVVDESGKRRKYELLSPVFQPRENQKQVSADTPQKALSMCPKCRLHRRLSKAGWCHGCVRDNSVERKVAEILGKNPEATQEQVYLQMKAGGSKAIQRAIRKIRGAA